MRRGVERKGQGYLHTRGFFENLIAVCCSALRQKDTKLALKCAFSKNIFSSKIYKTFNFKTLISSKKFLQLSTIGCIKPCPTEFILFHLWFSSPSLWYNAGGQLLSSLSQNLVHNRLSQLKVSGIF